MGLTVSPIAPAEIKIAGTDLTVPNVYARIYMACMPDGIKMSIGYEIFASKAMYAENKPLSTDVPNQSFDATLDPTTEEQTISVALQKAKEGFELMGYSVVIDTE